MTQRELLEIASKEAENPNRCMPSHCNTYVNGFLRCYEMFFKEQTEVNKLALGEVIGSINSVKEVMDAYLPLIEKEIADFPNDKELKGAKFSYKVAMAQFKNRLGKYCL